MENHSQNPDLEKVLFDQAAIQTRVRELAAQISGDYADGQLTLVTILRGGVIFLSDLSRELKIEHAFDVVGASSYGGHAVSTGQVLITKDIDTPIQGRDVLLVEDIYDTGRTLHVVCDLLRVHNPRSLEICAFLVKKRPRAYEIPIKYVGFEIPNIFVVGYGLDYNERYRHLNCIGALKSEVYR